MSTSGDTTGDHSPDELEENLEEFVGFFEIELDADVEESVAKAEQISDEGNLDAQKWPIEITAEVFNIVSPRHQIPPTGRINAKWNADLDVRPDTQRNADSSSNERNAAQETTGKGKPFKITPRKPAPTAPGSPHNQVPYSVYAAAGIATGRTIPITVVLNKPDCCATWLVLDTQPVSYLRTKCAMAWNVMVVFEVDGISLPTSTMIGSLVDPSGKRHVAHAVSLRGHRQQEATEVRWSSESRMQIRTVAVFDADSQELMEVMRKSADILLLRDTVGKQWNGRYKI